ncbi:NAD(P)-dependent oxidoreductase [Albirhodobacter sp. R86504]|uniref:NAD(P)-dependent oxidoreductase n=1 Tax=Albirhodobacter sp. R86504 TaxID=3093848 RepID=UPI00366EA8D2
MPDQLASNTPLTGGIVPSRLSAQEIAENFSDIAPCLSDHEALVASDRCYFCHDAPCMTACPTSIDVPLFIRQIATGTPEAAAKTILSQNILGGMCARVCPTENLCEGACVREMSEGKPVEIGALQRYATDRMMDKPQPFTRATPTGKTVAVVGAGPAGLSCAHRLAMKGHDVTLFDARPKSGGLNEYGIAAYKAPDDFAQKEVDWLLTIGGITVQSGWTLGASGTLADLEDAHDAVFLGLGLGGVNALSLEGAEFATPATEFIEALRQADLAMFPIGRKVVVIGGGMTAVDAAVQAKLLGAETSTIVYRRGREDMPASHVEQEHALANGVRIITHATPKALKGNGALHAVEFSRTDVAGETFTLKADQCFTAIGQTLIAPDGITLNGRKIAISGAGRTNRAGVWAGGDCAAGGDDLTVTAVAEGRDAADDIHNTLMGG